MTQSKYPAGWDEARVRRVLEHYEAQSDEEAVAEDEAAYEGTTQTMMEVPVDLVPLIRELERTREEQAPVARMTELKGARDEIRDSVHP
jgi:hypothetical protein